MTTLLRRWGEPVTLVLLGLWGLLSAMQGFALSIFVKKALHDQFGSQYDWENRRSRFKFRSDSITQIQKRVHLAYPTLRVSFPEDKDGIMLHPSPTPVPHVPSKGSCSYAKTRTPDVSNRLRKNGTKEARRS